MLKIVSVGGALILSASASVPWTSQALAAGTMAPLTCDVSDPESSIETCTTLIEQSKEVLKVTEEAIRSMSVSDPDRSKTMHHYGQVQKKLEKYILNKSKIQSRLAAQNDTR